MGQRVDIDDLIDANGVAELLGLAHRNTVSVYQHRYPDCHALSSTSATDA
jgi:hypothetical protein